MDTKLAFISIVLFLPCILWANGPIFQHKDTYEQQEFENAYQNIATLNSQVGGIPFVNVLSFGAKGDGVFDNTNSINTAIKSIASTGGTVFFPGGNYGISNRIIIPSSVTVLGSGMGTTRVFALAGFPADKEFFLLAQTDGTHYTATARGLNISVKDIQLDCSGMPSATGFGTAQGIYVPNIENFVAERVYVKSTQGYGINLEGDVGTYGVVNPRISYCVLKNCGIHGTQDTIAGGFIQGSVYNDNLCDAPNGTCIDNVQTKNAIWRNNRSINSLAHNGNIWSDFGMTDSQIINNYIENGSIHIFGFLTNAFVGAPSNVLIQGNQINNAGSSAILVDPANQTSADGRTTTGIRIIGNILNGCTDYCIAVNDSSAPIISGNILNNWSNGSAGSAAILLEGGPNLSLGTHNASITNNTGTLGNSSTWYYEPSPGGAAPTNGNFLSGNVFPNSTHIISLVTPISRVIGNTNYTSAVGSNVNATTTNHYVDIASVTVNAGEWEINANGYLFYNGATITAFCQTLVSTTPGDSSAGATIGDNLIYISNAPTNQESNFAISDWHLVAASRTTIFLKGLANYAGGPPQWNGRVSAR